MAVRRNGSIGAALVAAFALALAGAPALAESHEGGESGAMEEGMQEGMEEGAGAHGDVAARVSEKLGAEEGLSGVHAEAHEGTITLRGTVSDATHRQRAEEIASNVEGVQTVRNEIRIGDVASPPPGAGAE